MTPWQLRQTCRKLDQSGVIAYPTETIYGLGCDPDDPIAVMKLLDVKHRDVAKGFIIIASSWKQLKPYVGKLKKEQKEQIKKPHKKPVTWVVPASEDAPPWITGAHDTIAVRITTHPVTEALCGARNHGDDSRRRIAGGRIALGQVSAGPPLTG